MNLTILRLTELSEIISQIECLDRKFVVEPLTDGLFTVHVEYLERDVEKGATSEPELQKSRRWIIDVDDDEDAIVNTCFACVMRSYDHVVQEHFRYQGARVFSPHFEIHDRLQLARRYR